MIRLMISLLVLTAGCMTPILDDQGVQVSASSYGLYLPHGDGMAHLVTTTSLPCSTKTVLGAELLMSYFAEQRGRYQLAIEFFVPEVPGFRPARLQFPQASFEVNKGSGDFEYFVALALDTEADLVNGTYEHRVSDPVSGRIHYSQIYTMNECD